MFLEFFPQTWIDYSMCENHCSLSWWSEIPLLLKLFSNFWKLKLNMALERTCNFFFSFFNLVSSLYEIKLYCLLLQYLPDFRWIWVHRLSFDFLACFFISGTSISPQENSHNHSSLHSSNSHSNPNKSADTVSPFRYQCILSHWLFCCGRWDNRVCNCRPCCLYFD